VFRSPRSRSRGEVGGVGAARTGARAWGPGKKFRSAGPGVGGRNGRFASGSRGSESVVEGGGRLENWRPPAFPHRPRSRPALDPSPAPGREWGEGKGEWRGRFGRLWYVYFQGHHHMMIRKSLGCAVTGPLPGPHPVHDFEGASSAWSAAGDAARPFTHPSSPSPQLDCPSRGHEGERGRGGTGWAGRCSTPPRSTAT